MTHPDAPHAGITQEISLACRALAHDDGPSRLRERGMSIEKLGQCFVAVEGPRCSGKVEHRLVEVLVVAVCAVIACAGSWNDVAPHGRSKLAWLRTFLELANSPKREIAETATPFAAEFAAASPSHATFRRVFMLIGPDAFEAGFAAWVGPLIAGFEREVVATDGKTVRRSFDHGREQSPLHVVSAWASEQGLVLGHSRKLAETAWFAAVITAALELLDKETMHDLACSLPGKPVGRCCGGVAPPGSGRCARQPRGKRECGGGMMPGRHVPVRTVLWAAGVMASPTTAWLGVEPDKAGRVKVGADLEVAGLDGVHAIGDTAASGG